MNWPVFWPPIPGADAAYDAFTDELATGEDPWADEWETPPRPSTITPSIEEPARV